MYTVLVIGDANQQLITQLREKLKVRFLYVSNYIQAEAYLLAFKIDFFISDSPNIPHVAEILNLKNFKNKLDELH